MGTKSDITLIHDYSVIFKAGIFSKECILLVLNRYDLFNNITLPHSHATRTIKITSNAGSAGDERTY
jgi:hypothetical protein